MAEPRDAAHRRGVELVLCHLRWNRLQSLFCPVTLDACRIRKQGPRRRRSAYHLPKRRSAELGNTGAAIDVAKATGMVCTRVPHASITGKRLGNLSGARVLSAKVTQGPPAPVQLADSRTRGRRTDFRVLIWTSRGRRVPLEEAALRRPLRPWISATRRRCATICFGGCPVRRYRHFGITVASAALLFSVCSTAAGSPVCATAAILPGPRVINCGGEKPTVRPSGFEIACADGYIDVYNIRWQSWTARAASGRGILEMNTCRPDCVGGKWIRTPTRIDFMHPVLTHAFGRLFSMATITALSPQTYWLATTDVVSAGPRPDYYSEPLRLQGWWLYSGTQPTFSLDLVEQGRALSGSAFLAPSITSCSGPSATPLVVAGRVLGTNQLELELTTPEVLGSKETLVATAHLGRFSDGSPLLTVTFADGSSYVMDPANVSNVRSTDSLAEKCSG